MSSLTPVTASTFQLGDEVYCPSLLDGEIYVVKANNKATNIKNVFFVSNDSGDCYSFGSDGYNAYNNPVVYHATPENQKALQTLHPDTLFVTKAA